MTLNLLVGKRPGRVAPVVTESCSSSSWALLAGVLGRRPGTVTGDLTRDHLFFLQGLSPEYLIPRPS